MKYRYDVVFECDECPARLNLWTTWRKEVNSLSDLDELIVMIVVFAVDK